MQQRLLCCLLGMAAAIAPLVARAMSDLEHVVVTVPIHKKEAETALPVTVLSGDELREAAAASIGETLNGRPGLAIASFGPGVGQAVIRGQQGPRVKVLQNSTGSLDASRVSADHAVSVEPLLAERIEVLRGPATLLYGGGAIGGVVNVIDGRIPARPIDQPRGALEVRHASGADEDTVVFLGEAATGVLNWHVSGLYRDWGLVEIPGSPLSPAARADGHHAADHGKGSLANSQGRTEQLNLGGSWTSDRGYLGLAISSLESGYGIPPGGHAHADDHGHHGHDHHDAEDDAVRLDIERTRIDLAGEYRPDGRIEALRGRLTYSDYEHREIEAGETGTRYSNEAWEGRFELVHGKLAGWHGVLGLQVQQSDFAALGHESFIPRSDTQGLGLFLVEDLHRGDWTWELGLRVDQDRVDPEGYRAVDFTSVSGSASALWDVSEAWGIGLAMSRSERAPAVEELFSNVGNSGPALVVHGATRSVEIGTVDLDTEVARNVDLSVRWRGAGWELSTAFFYNDFQDFIHLANTGMAINPGTAHEFPVLAYRQQNAEFRGVEYVLAMPAIAIGWGSLRFSVYGDVIRGELADGSDVPYLPPRRIGLRADLEAGPVRAYVDVLDAGRQDRAGRHETATAGYTRLDAGVNYRTMLLGVEADLFLRGLNLTDEEIRSSTSLLRDIAPEPGRSLVAGLRLTF